MEKLTEEQEEKLCLASLPLRNYLMKYVLPTLTQGLIEVANLRPDDPVDYLVSRKSNPPYRLRARLMSRKLATKLFFLLRSFLNVTFSVLFLISKFKKPI